MIKSVLCPSCGVPRDLAQASRGHEQRCHSCGQTARHTLLRGHALMDIVRALIEAVAVAQYIATTPGSGGSLWPLRRDVERIAAALAALADDLTAQHLHAHVTRQSALPSAGVVWGART